MQAQASKAKKNVTEGGECPRRATVEDLAGAAFPVTLYEVSKRFVGDQLIDVSVSPLTITGFANDSRKDGDKCHVDGFDNNGDPFRAHPGNFYLTESDALAALISVRDEEGLLVPVPASDELLAQMVMPVTLYEVVKIMREGKLVDAYVAPIMVLRHGVDGSKENQQMTITAIDKAGERFHAMASDFYMTEYGAMVTANALLDEAAMAAFDDDDDLCRHCGEEINLDGYDGLCGNCADVEDSCELD